MSRIESEGFSVTIVIAQRSKQGASEGWWRRLESARGHRRRGLLGAIDVSRNGIEGRSSILRADILRIALGEHAAEGETHRVRRGKSSNRGTKWDDLLEFIELIVNIQHN